MTKWKDNNDHAQWGDFLKGIKQSQVYDFMMYASMNGEVIDDFPHLKALHEQEKRYVNQKYNVSSYNK